MVAPLPEGRHRRSVIRCYVTRDQKAVVAALARDVAMSESDLVRLFLVTADARSVERLRHHPDYLIMKDANR